MSLSSCHLVRIVLRVSLGGVVGSGAVALAFANRLAARSCLTGHTGVRRVVDAARIGRANLALLANALALIIVHCHAHWASHCRAQIGLIIAHCAGADLGQDTPNFAGILVAGL